MEKGAHVLHLEELGAVGGVAQEHIQELEYDDARLLVLVLDELQQQLERHGALHHANRLLATARHDVCRHIVGILGREWSQRSRVTWCGGSRRRTQKHLKHVDANGAERLVPWGGAHARGRIGARQGAGCRQPRQRETLGRRKVPAQCSIVSHTEVVCRVVVGM